MKNETPSVVAAEIEALILEIEELKKQVRDLQIVVASTLNK
jgi:hypothetical protein